MRTCPSCGAQFSDHEVFCPVCGQEVQIVPDFVTTEIQLQELHKKIEEEERAQEEARQRAEMIRRRIRQRRNHIILIIVLAAAAIAACFVITHAMEVRREHASYPYQFAQARAMYEQKDYASAKAYVQQALLLQPDDREALLLEVKILQAENDHEEAENLLFHFMELFPEDADGYYLLIEQYLEDNRTEDVQTILMDCTLPAVLEKYARFLPGGPVLYPEEGIYNSDQDIYLTTEVKGTVYYTTDGSDPTSSSEVYDGPIALQEGIYTIKAMLITNEGFPSPVTAGIYQIQYDAPPPPAISPDSGMYSIMQRADEKGIIETSEREKEKKIEISYPDGFICHYSFDSKPTKDSPVYNRPLEMRRGEHIFYAVLESENGKLGMIASATYVYDVRTITPTPTPKPAKKYYNLTPQTTPTPQPTQETTPAAVTVPGDTGAGGTDTGGATTGGMDAGGATGGTDTGGATGGTDTGSTTGGTDTGSTTGGTDTGGTTGGADTGAATGGTDTGSTTGGTDTGGTTGGTDTGAATGGGTDAGGAAGGADAGRTGGAADAGGGADIQSSPAAADGGAGT